jgi:hypothetical protein
MQNFGRFEIFKSSFLIFKNNVQILNILLFFRVDFQKLKNKDLKNLKHFKFWHPTRFSYEEFNEHDKSKFERSLWT